MNTAAPGIEGSRATWRSIQANDPSPRRSPATRPGEGRGRGRRRHRAAVQGAIRDLERRRGQPSGFSGPVDVKSPDGKVAAIGCRRTARAPTTRRTRRWRRSAESSSRHVGHGPGRQANVSGLDRRSRRTSTSMMASACRSCSRSSRAGVPAAAGDVPLARHRDQGDRAQHAVGRRRLRRARPGLPARAGSSRCSASSPPGDQAWLPLFLFVVLFGLSMDYHVFILSRIREAYDAG